MQSNATLQVSRWADHRLITLIDQAYGNLCLGQYWIEGKASLPDFSTDAPTTISLPGFASGVILRRLTVNNDVFLVNGYDVPRILTGVTLREAGADAAPVPGIAVGPAGALTGSYSALYTYKDSKTGYETSPAFAAPTLIALVSQQLTVSVVASSNARFDKIRIYRNTNGIPDTFLFDQEITNATASVNSSQADTALGAEVSYSNYRPPITKYVAKTGSRIFWAGAVPYKDGTCSVQNGSRLVTFTENPPPAFYTRNVESPFYFNINGGPRYGVDPPDGTTGANQILLSTPYQETTQAGLGFILSALTTRVYYSNISPTGLVQSESWLPSNFFDIGLPADSPGRGFPEEITALLEFGNRLYVFCRYSIWYFDPLVTQKRRTSASMGTLSDRTIVKDKSGNLVFMGSDMQAYAFNGTSNVPISAKISNRFMKKSRYNLNLMEFAHAYYDAKEGFMNLFRPAAAATLSAMRYLIDTYDDLGGHWTEKDNPRVSATCQIRDSTRQLTVGTDTLGLVQVLDDYETSDTFGDDVFPSSSPTIFTSVAGEISPGVNAQGKCAVIFNATAVKGTKLIVGTQTSNASVEDLLDAVTIAAGDQYMVGGQRAFYEVGWFDGGDPRIMKASYYISGTMLKTSPGYLYFFVYVDENPVADEVVRVDTAAERQFKVPLMARGRQFKLRWESVTEGVGFAIRDLKFDIQPAGDAN